MNKEELIKILGENIKLYGLLFYFTNNKKRQALYEKYKKADSDFSTEKNRLAMNIVKNNIPLQGPSAFIIGLIISFIIWKKLIPLKGILFIILLLITGGIIAEIIRKGTLKLLEANAFRNDKELKRDYKEKEQIYNHYKSINQKYASIDKLITNKILENFKTIAITNHDEQLFKTCAFYYIYLTTEKASSIEKCQRLYKHDPNTNKDYYTNSMPKSNESFESYFERCIKEIKFDLEENELNQLLDTLPKLSDDNNNLINKFKSM